MIDVRDLAAWLLVLAEERTTGTYDAVGEPVPLGDLLAQVATGVGDPRPAAHVGRQRLPRGPGGRTLGR